MGFWMKYLHTTNSLTKALLKNTLETGHPSTWLVPSTPNIWQHDSTIHTACLNSELLSCCTCILHFWLLATSKTSSDQALPYAATSFRNMYRYTTVLGWNGRSPSHLCWHTVNSWQKIPWIKSEIRQSCSSCWSSPPFLLQAHHGGDHLNSMQFSTRKGTNTMNLCQPPIRNSKISPLPHWAMAVLRMGTSVWSKILAKSEGITVVLEFSHVNILKKSPFVGLRFLDHLPNQSVWKKRLPWFKNSKMPYTSFHHYLYCLA